MAEQKGKNKKPKQGVDLILKREMKLAETRQNIGQIKHKATRYHQIEDICYINQTMNEEAINNLNQYLNNLKKVREDLRTKEDKQSRTITRYQKQYKQLIVKYNQKKKRGLVFIFFLRRRVLV